VLRAAFVLPVLAFALAPAAWGQAQPQPQPKSVGVFESWSAWEFGDAAARICYLSATPTASQTKPPGARRGDIRLTISHRPAARTRDEISFQAGYPIKSDKPVQAIVDGTRTFELSRRAPNQAELIWTKDPETDKAMLAAMRTGKELVVNGTSQRGTTTTDSFKLDGFVKALEAANRACGLR
jgi:hypothetical protein